MRALLPTVPPEFVASVARTPLKDCPVRFGVVCPMRWNALRRTADARVRHCDTCGEAVTLCRTVEEAEAVADADGCVAFETTEAWSPGTLEQEVSSTVLGRPPRRARRRMR